MGDLEGMRVKDREDAVAKVVKENAERNEPMFRLGPLKIGKPRWAWSQQDYEDFKSK
ncbi:hypothetical protein [Aureimonas flava]|uniref:hypothetical protein n=1 Tax=Aureimonas flava TaxID=2320271 RepID=UPI001459FFEA|nr:hypothetical protein [Aureimonas flava]